METTDQPLDETTSTRKGRAWLTPTLLALVGCLVPLVIGWLVHPVDIGGSDPGMWETAARDVSLGGPSPIAPFFPFLISLLHGGLGLPWDQAGWGITLVSTAALGPVTWWLARQLGAPSKLAALAALCVLAEPWLACSSYQCQPDSLTALSFVLALLAALAWVRTPDWKHLLVMLLVVGLLPQIREHAATLSLGMLVLLVLTRGPWHQRGLRLVLGVLAILCLPVLAGEPPALPWQHFWVQARWGEVITHFFASDAPAHLERTPRAFSEAFAASYAQGSRLRIALLHARLSFLTGHSPWLWLGLAAVAIPLLRRHRLVVLIGLLPAIAVLGGAQQPRHLAVLVPIAAASWVAALSRFRIQERLVMLAITAAIVGLCLMDSKHATTSLRKTAEYRHAMREMCEELCDRLPSDAVYTGEMPRTLIYCDRPFMRRLDANQTNHHLYWVGMPDRPLPRDWPKLKQRGWVPMELESSFGEVVHRPPPGRE